MTTKTKTPDPAADRMAAQHAARMGNDPLLTPAPTFAETKRIETLEAQVASLQVGAPRGIPQPVVDAVVAAVGGKFSGDNVRGLITQECRALEAMLHEKNEKYGNSALEPRRIFSKASPVEQICVRIDDKISRISNMGFAAADEDTLQDLQGYITLLRVAHRLGMR